jgi:glycosyltransferase involved in cell wall biosynthesis
MPKCDLQVHSCFSDRPSEWILRKLGVPESYTQPEELYEKLKAASFQYVTMTDLNRIEGCLRIADRPGAFISEKVTTYFPNDPCKIQLLVWNITEKQHEEIQQLRANIYELTAWLREQGIVHGVAHLLYNVNDRLTLAHVEKLILLFRVFETLNGTRDPLSGQITELCLKALTPAVMDELANTHGFASTYAEPWKKSFFGGSEDYGGLYFGQAWTEVDHASSLNEFLAAVESGQGRAVGRPGDVHRVGTSIYRVIFNYAKDRLGKTAPKGMDLLGKVAQRFLEGKNPTNLSFGEWIGHVGEAIRSGKAIDFFKPNDPSFNREVVKYFLNPQVKKELDAIIRIETTPERRTFRMASKIGNDLFYRLFLQVMERVNKGEFLDCLQPSVGMLPIVASVCPYFFSYYGMHTKREMLLPAAKRFLGEVPKSLQNTKRAWFTDTLDDINGVARTISTMTKSASRLGYDMRIIVSRNELKIDDIPIKNFEPVGEFELPEYELQKLTFPPLLEMIDYIEREKFTECVISTPGPVGLTAVAAARLLGLKTCGIYHTDFPQYVRILTEDQLMETLMWKFMYWFYSQMDIVYVNSEFYRQCWIERGIAPEKLEILPRGLDTELFHYSHRETDFWRKRGAKHPVMLYVGRISKEKELRFLAELFLELRKRGTAVDLAIVGEGPFEAEMKKMVPDAIFTGVLRGAELGVAYASAELFMFPSTTDTFGNVVIEALSSALPVFVSDVGGPKELILKPTHGLILAANQMEPWLTAVQSYLSQPTPIEIRKANADMIQKERNWDHAFEAFWKRSL